jgi:hypothetical protein
VQAGRRERAGTGRSARTFAIRRAHGRAITWLLDRLVEPCRRRDEALIDWGVDAAVLPRGEGPGGRGLVSEGAGFCVSAHQTQERIRLALAFERQGEGNSRSSERALRPALEGRR